MTTIVIAYHSGYHHTEAVALEVAKGVESTGVNVILHNVENPVDRIWSDLANADGIIFGSPTYMGSVSGPFKVFMDKTSKAWAEQRWKDKIGAGFTCSHSLSGDKLNTLQTLAVLAAQHGMVWVGHGVLPDTVAENGHKLNRIGSSLGFMAQAENAPATETPPPDDRSGARVFGIRIAEATQRWVAGKKA